MVGVLFFSYYYWCYKKRVMINRFREVLVLEIVKGKRK